MSEQFYGNLKTGVTKISIPVLLRDSSTNGAKTGVAHTSVTAKYWRQGQLPSAISLSALGSVDAVHTAGGWIEPDSINQPGLYRLDLPDAMFAVGSETFADWVMLSVIVSGTHGYYERFNLESGGTKAIFDEITDSDYGLAQLVRAETPANLLAVDSSGRAAGDLEAWKGSVPSDLITGLVQAQANQLGTQAKTDVSTEVAAELDESIGELSPGSPASSPSVRTGIMLLYMAVRDKATNDGTWLTFHNASGTAIAKARISEVTGLFTREAMQTP